MSASSKKKLRNAQNAENLTEKQQAELKDAKKLKIYTTIFVVVLVLMVVFAVAIGGGKALANSGLRERNTVALTINDHEISNAELNYFYVDTVSNFYSQYGSYVSMMGLDPTKPLDSQVMDEETGETWADNFLASTEESVKAAYALADEAKKQGFTLNEDQTAMIDNAVSTMEMYAMYNQFPDVKTFLKTLYGSGASVDGYREYVELTTLADSYQAEYSSSLEYDDAALREAEKDNYAEYSSFTYNSYYLSASKFLEGGTTDENGNVTYSDEEKAASVAAAKKAADELAAGEYASVQELDEAIAALEINKDTENAATIPYVDNAYHNITTHILSWVTDPSRQEGDVASIVNKTTSTAEDGTETETVNGYYLVYFFNSNDNIFPLANVRHILVGFEGGTTDENGNKVYSEDEKAAAQATADEILSIWKHGDSTEESFAALAAERSSDPGSKENGGLYENVFPGQMVPAFNDWCFDESRRPGDTGIVETSYGYHVMFFCDHSDITFRDYQIKNYLTSQDTMEWYNALVDAMTMTEKNTKYIRTDMILGAA